MLQLSFPLSYLCLLLVGSSQNLAVEVTTKESETSAPTGTGYETDTNTSTLFSTEIPQIKPPAKRLEPQMDERCNYSYIPASPLVYCSYLPDQFIFCENPVNHHGNVTAQKLLGYGCLKFGGQRVDEVEHTKVICRALKGIECYGNRTFLRDGFPCIKYNGHYFLSTLLFSILLGFLGIDRFCLGHTGTAVGKLLTVGGLGIWWLIDIVLLATGSLVPEDGSNWMPYY